MTTMTTGPTAPARTGQHLLLADPVAGPPAHADDAGSETAALHPLHADLTRRLAARPVPAGRAPLPHEVREAMALAALRAVIEVHHPAVGIGSWITCAECCTQAWPPPEGGAIWSGTEYPCATVQGIAGAYGLGWQDQFGRVHPARHDGEHAPEAGGA